MKYHHIFIVACLASCPALAEMISTQKANCKVFRLSNQKTLKVTWHGTCEKGFANGLGVTRYLKSNKVEQTFFGMVKQGYWDIGALETADGYKFGNFQKNEVIPPKTGEEFKIRDKAFEIASQAALQTSEAYEKDKNNASAKFYKEKSAQLLLQMGE